MIDNGSVKLVEENGKMFAQLRKNGKYFSKLPIKKENLNAVGFNSGQAINSLQLAGMQQLIIDIKEEVEEISKTVGRIYTGQQNDRIALYYAGMNLYIEALNIEDSNIKKLLYSHALKEFTESTCKLTLEMQESINNLRTFKSKFIDTKSGTKLLNYISSIQQSYAFIHQSFLMKATIYAKLHETKTMVKTLQEYSSFLDYSINKNLKLLQKYDINDDGTNTSLWCNRTKLIKNINKVCDTIENSNEVILLLGDDLNEEI